MSYILEALKRSQQERELGQVPTLSDAAFAEPGRNSPSTPWVSLAVAIALLAMFIALYAAFATRHPELPLAGSGVTPPATKPRPGPTTPVPATTPPPREAHPPPGTGFPATAATPLDLASDHGSPPPAPVPAAATAPPAPARVVRTAPSPPAAAHLAPPRTGGLPADLLGDVERFRGLVRKEGALPELRNPPPAPEPPPKAPAKRILATAPAPEANAPPGFRELAADDQARIPAHRLTVHVYAGAPEGRFVILNSHKLRVGERTPDGLLLEAVQPDGVVLEFEEIRFFLPR